MKKMLLLLVCLTTFAWLHAEDVTVTLDLTNPSTLSLDGGTWTNPADKASYYWTKFGKEGITVDVDFNGATDKSRLRFFNNGSSIMWRCSSGGGAKKQTFTISAPGNITKIVFTQKKIAVTANPEGLSSSSSSTSTWTGDAESVTFTTTGENQFTNIAVTYTKADETKVATPTFSHEAGDIEVGTAVTISCGTEGATIHYYVNGVDKGEYVKDTPIVINEVTTIEAMASKEGLTESDVAEAKFTPIVAAPTFSVAAGGVEAGTKVALSCTTPGATIEYALDGGTMVEYTAPIEINKTTKIEAWAVKGNITSDPVEAIYTIKAVVPGGNSATFDFTKEGIIDGTTGKPVVMPSDMPSENGTNLSNVIGDNVEIIFAKTGTETNPRLWNTKGQITLRLYKGNTMTIRATNGYRIEKIEFDGTLTGITSETGVFTDGIWTLAKNKGLKEVLFNSTGKPQIKTITVTYKPVVATPSFNPVSGSTFSEETPVDITCTTKGAKIYYTTDDKEPTTASTLFETSIIVTKTTTIKAIAVAEGYLDSDVATATYVFETTNNPSAEYDFTNPTGLVPAKAVPSFTADDTNPAEAARIFVDERRFYNNYTQVEFKSPAVATYENKSQLWNVVEGVQVRSYNGSQIIITGAEGLRIDKIEFVGAAEEADLAGISVVGNLGAYTVDGTVGTWTRGGVKALAVGEREEIVFNVATESSVKLKLISITTSGIATGVEDVTVDENAPVEYYNLQGVRVANPENGIYIRRQGSKVSKVLVR